MTMRFNTAIVLATSLISFTGCNELRARNLDAQITDQTSEAARAQQDQRRRLPELTEEQREQVRERVRHRSRAPETDYCALVAALSENQQIVDSADIDVILGSWGRVGSAADINADNIVDGADLGIGLGCFEGPVPGDFDGDGAVTMGTDYVLLLNMFGMIVSESPEAAPYDLSSDGVVDAADIAVFLSYIL
jgi:hypothetical protein